MDEQTLASVIRSVQGGVHWLKESAESLKDARDLAIVIRALIAAERNHHSHLVQRLVGMLSRLQSENGSWNDELWDTAWALQALAAYGLTVGSPPVDAGLRFMLATFDSIAGNWYEEPYETMLVLDTALSLSDKAILAIAPQPLAWLASLQRHDGCVIGIRYTGMFASLFHLARARGIVDGASAYEQAVTYIRSDLQKKPIWSNAGWSNYYPLRALLEGGASMDDPGVLKAVDWFLGAQDRDGKWMQVSRVHDTAMAILAMSHLLTVPLVDVSAPKTGILNANRENGTIRVSFHGPHSGAIAPAEKMKISEQVRSDLSLNQQIVVSALGTSRNRDTRMMEYQRRTHSAISELEKAGRYAYGHLVPARIQMLLESSPADHLRLDIDERLIDLPWELIHDGTDFLCLRYAVGRRLISDYTFQAPRLSQRPIRETRVLVVADPTGDLPAARHEGEMVASLLRDRCGMRVDIATAAEITKKDFLLGLKDYDLVHYAGHASHDADSPDQSCLVFSDGEIQAFEIGRFIAARSPAVVFLNACWSAEELRHADSYSPMMRGLGRTFLFSGVSAFVGYLVPVPDDSATKFAVTFYENLAQGQTIGESVRRSRVICRDTADEGDLMWSSALLYGDPTVRPIEADQLRLS